MGGALQNRRTFLKNGLLVCLGAGGVAWTRRAGAQFSSENHRWGMIIDLNRCTGCQSCVVACKLQNHTVENRFNTEVLEKKTGEYPDARPYFMPTQCNQCDDPPCMEACGEQAIFKMENGIVATDWSKCTGQGDCVDACPYDARFLDARFGGRSDKCDFCLHRLEKAMVPACVEACAPKARIWGDFDKPEGEFADYLKKAELISRPPDRGIETSVLYKWIARGAS